jgi:hypothetical protein
LDEKVKTQAEEQRGKVREMERTGVLTRSQARGYQEDLANPDAQQLMDVMKNLEPYTAQLKAAKALEEKERAIAQATKDREESDKIIAEQKKHQADETARMSKEYRTMREEGRNIRTEAQKVDASVPTLEDLAGREFTQRLNKDYGAGGRYDLGKGDGPLGAAARESELAAKQMQWDLTYGNGQWVEGKNGEPGHFTGQAELDRKRKIAADNILGAAGLDTPNQKFEAMKQHLLDISTDMSALLERAENEGINIAVPEDK